MVELQTNRQRNFKFLLSGIFLNLLFVTGCSLGNSSAGAIFTSACNIPQDQSGTISGHWSSTPIPIALHQNDFDNNEISAITAAADTWNSFFNASKHSAAITYSSGSSTNSSTIANPSNGNTLSCASLGIASTTQPGTPFSGHIVIYKLAQWAHASSAMALTSFCTQTTAASQSSPGGFPYMYLAIIELNYQNFFAQGQKLPDLQTILLHEFGHIMGLNHSCETTSKSGTPNCNDPNLTPDYVAASMFPVFGFDNYGMGQQKRILGVNDESRVNCLYNASSTTN